MYPTKIKFAYLKEKFHAELAEIDLPELKSDELLVKQEACNICTTDYQQWAGLREHQNYPMAGGHEIAGTVIAKGADVANAFDVGDQVSVLFDYCGMCDSCKSGDITYCQNKKQFGLNYSDKYYGLFGFANYFIRKAKSFVKVSNDLSPSEAAFVEPLSSIIRGMDKIRINSGFDTVVVIGAGTMGLLNAATAKAMGARVIVSAHNDKKIATAKKMGLEVINAKEEDPVSAIKKMTDGNGADIVIVAVGTTSAYAQALAMAKEKDAKILLYAAGYPAPTMEVDPNTIHYRRLEIIGTFASTIEDFKLAAKMLSERTVDVSMLVEDKIDLDHIQEAMKLACDKNSFRVSVILNKD